MGLEPGQELEGLDPLVALEKFKQNVYGAPYINDLEPPAFEVLPMLKDLRDDLSKLGFQVSSRLVNWKIFFSHGGRGVDPLCKGLVTSLLIHSDDAGTQVGRWLLLNNS